MHTHTYPGPHKCHTTYGYTTHAHTHTHTHTHHTPGHVFTVGMDVHLKPLVVVELLPDGCLVLWPEHGPRLGRSSVIFLCIHHLSIVRKGPDGKRELSKDWAWKRRQRVWKRRQRVKQTEESREYRTSWSTMLKVFGCGLGRHFPCSMLFYLCRCWIKMRCETMQTTDCYFYSILFPILISGFINCPDQHAAKHTTTHSRIILSRSSFTVGRRLSYWSKSTWRQAHLRHHTLSGASWCANKPSLWEFPASL